MRIVLWTVMPSHYCRAFVAGLRDRGHAVQVVYFGVVNAARCSMNWNDGSILAENEQCIDKSADVDSLVRHYRDWVHIVTGYGNAILRRLVLRLCAAGITRVHWSECSRPGIWRLMSLPLKLWYGRLVNKYAVGAFAIGRLAASDLRRWGIWAERIAYLPYVAAPAVACDSEVAWGDSFRTEDPLFLFCGSIERRKGVDILISAVGRLKKVGYLLDSGSPNL